MRFSERVCSDYDTRRVEICIRFAEGCDDAITASFGRAEINEEDLILIVVNDGAEVDFQPDEVGCGELALEDGVLKVVAVTAHGLKDLAQAFVIADVVADEEGFAH
jgi:hypothetical protein